MNELNIEQKVSATAFSMFMRQLHILALVQHSTCRDNMNYRSMADLLSLVPWDDDIDSKKISRCVDRLKDMGFPLHTGRGENRVMLDRELSNDEMLEILPYYLNLVSETVGIRDCFKSYVESHGSRSLWIIARIYFASLDRKRIKLSYRSVNSAGVELYDLNPYMWVYRDNAVYLVARNINRGENISLFRLNRIKDVEVTDDRFNDTVPPADELLKRSMGAFIGSMHYNIKLRSAPEYRDRLEEDFGHLDPAFSEPGDGYLYTGFIVSDLVNLCTAVFSYCGSVRIIEPAAAVDQMKMMIQANLVL